MGNDDISVAVKNSNRMYIIIRRLVSVLSVLWFITRKDKRAHKKMKSKVRFWKFMQQVEFVLSVIPTGCLCAVIAKLACYAAVFTTFLRVLATP
jgi:hypothetical protein